MADVEVYADIVCPFTHASLRLLRAALDAAGSDARILVRAWPLEWVNGTPVDPALLGAEIAGLRDSAVPNLFTGFDPTRFPRSSIAALGLASRAYEHGPAIGEAISFALRTALWESGRDVSDPAVLGSIAAEHGVDVPDASEAEAFVRTEYESGRVRGAQGSPHFFVGGWEWFCPALEIRHDGRSFHVRRREEGYAALLRAVASNDGT